MSSCALPRARAGARARTATLTLPRGDDRGDARGSARRPARRPALGRLAAAVGAVSRGARRRSTEAREPRLEARDPLEHRPRPASTRRRRCSAFRSTRRSSRPRSARTSRRFATGRSSHARTRRRPERHVHVAASLFHDIAPGERARACRASGSTGSASTRPSPTASRLRSCPTSTSCLRRERSIASWPSGSRSYRPWPRPRIDVKVEQMQSCRRQTRSTRTHVPGCRSHYRDDELEAALYVCGQCGHHFPMPARARIAWLADQDSFVEEAGEVRSADPLDVLRPASVRRASRRGRAQHRTCARRSSSAAATLDGLPARARGDGLRLHGRLDGQRRRREVRARLRRPRSNGQPAAARHRVGRRAHAGGDPLADAAAEDGVRDRRAPRGTACRCSASSPHPTTGGVMASFASLGDVTIARAGRAARVHRSARRAGDDAEKLPEDFGRAEQNLRFGQIDAIRPSIRAAPVPGAAPASLWPVRPSTAARAAEQAARACPLLRGTNVTAERQRLRRQLRALSRARRRRPRTRSGQFVELARHPDRPYTLDYVERIVDDWVELHGDRGRADDGALVAGIGRLERADGRDRRTSEGARPEGAARPPVRDGVSRGLRKGDADDGHRRPFRISGASRSSTHPARIRASPPSSTARAVRSPGRRHGWRGSTCRASPA